MLKGRLTSCRRCAGNSRSSRLRIATSRSVEFLTFKLLAPWRSLISVHHTPSSHQPDFGGKQRSSAIHTDRLSSLSEDDVPSHASAKNAPALGMNKRPNKTVSQSNARHVPKNGQARRRPVEAPGPNNSVCLSFV